MKIVNQWRRRLNDGSIEPYQRLLMFEVGTDLVAIAVLDQESTTTGHVALVAVHRAWQGRALAGGKLSHIVLSTALDTLKADGYDRATSEVARMHVKSKALLTHLHFKFVSNVDQTYELHAVDL